MKTNVAKPQSNAPTIAPKPAPWKLMVCQSKELGVAMTTRKETKEAEIRAETKRLEALRRVADRD